MRDESHREFFRKVDEALAEIQKHDPVPVVVVGVDRYLAMYQEVTKSPDAVVGVLAGSYDDPNPSAPRQARLARVQGRCDPATHPHSSA